MVYKIDKLTEELKPFEIEARLEVLIKNKKDRYALIVKYFEEIQLNKKK